VPDPAELLRKFNDEQTRPNGIWSDSISELGIAYPVPMPRSRATDDAYLLIGRTYETASSL
jgi:hypothetical protein